ncbi:MULTISPECIES: NAD(P)/FAD-dependent oxidoreductase [unclassified Microbacterium]|uniref:NAD(P)/FAD-dependent oxidoreductase n=1 Tax=unclassified Microbacterium TaxID=2609290 RepID=UPI003465B8BC
MSEETLATADIVVVGAGIVGLCTAWELSKRGFEVVVVEQRFAGFGATSRNPGALWVQTKRLGPELDLARAGVAKYHEYRDELGDVFGFTQRGGIVFAEDSEGTEGLRQYASERTSAGLEISLLEGAELHAASRIMPDTAVAGAFCEEDSQIDSHQFVTALTAACTRRGIQIFEHTPVLSTTRAGEQVVGVQTLRGRIDAGGVVWATGAWATNLKLEGIVLPMKTLRYGQVMTQRVPGESSPILRGLRGTFSAGALEPWASTTKAATSGGKLLGYDDTLVQNRGGSIYVGHSIDGLNSLNPHITLDASRVMLDIAGERYERFGTLGVTGLWAGLSCLTPDGLPLVDKTDNVFVNVGHAWGVLSAPICGQLTADLITGARSELLNALSLSRTSLGRF